jgi:hypothetical protein
VDPDIGPFVVDNYVVVFSLDGGDDGTTERGWLQYWSDGGHPEFLFAHWSASVLRRMVSPSTRMGTGRSRALAGLRPCPTRQSNIRVFESLVVERMSMHRGAGVVAREVRANQPKRRRPKRACVRGDIADVLIAWAIAL